MQAFTLRRCLLIYVALFFGVTFPYWGEGQVTAPNRQLMEVGLRSIPDFHQTDSNYYSDIPDTFVPALTEHLTGPRSGWLALWTNDTELGRPIYHLSGFSPAYAPSWVLAQLTHSPWIFVTVLALGMSFLAGLFLILFCSEIGISPLAGLIAGATLGTAPMIMENLDYPMYLAGYCWSAGLLWALARSAQRPDLLGWVALAFCTYSMLIIAAPQLVVYNVYILAVYGAYLCYTRQRLGWRDVRRFVVLSASAILAGTVLTLPIFVDLARTVSESARISAPATWYMFGLPTLDSRPSFHRLVINVMPQIFTDGVPHYPFGNVGMQLTPLIVFFLVVGLICAFRKSWGWWLAAAVICVVSFYHPLYRFAVEHLGFDFDRLSPWQCMMLPISMVVAYGADALVMRHSVWRTRIAVAIAFLFVFGTLVYGVEFGIKDRYPMDWIMVIFMACMIILLGLQLRQIKPFVLVGTLFLTIVAADNPVMVRVPPQSIATTSPLVQKIRETLPPGSRFAFANYGPLLPPNFNAELGIPSIHSYDSISPKRYQALIRSLGGAVIQEGRWNRGIAPNYDSPQFWMSDVGLMLSEHPVADPGLRSIGRVSGLYMYTVPSHMGSSLQVRQSDVTLAQDEVDVADPRALKTSVPTKLSDEGDRLDYQVTPGPPSVLILSQIFHGDWKAEVLEDSKWIEAKTAPVDGIFQGVLVPQGAARVRLEFLPFVRFAWISNLFWLVAALALLVRPLYGAWRARRLQPAH